MGKYNLKFIKELTSDNESEIQEFLLIFCRDVLEAINRIKAGFDLNNLDEMKFYAHKMKTSLKYLDLQDELISVIDIEKTTDFSNYSDLQNKVDFVYTSLQEVIKELKINELKMEIVQE